MELTRGRKAAGLGLALLLTANDVAQSEYDQAYFADLSYSSYFFLVWFTTSLAALAFPLAVAAEHAWRRATLREGWREYVGARLRPRLEENARVSGRAAAAVAAANVLSTYMWYASLSSTPVSVNSPLSRACTLVLVFAVSVVVLREQATARKVAAVAVALAGVALTGYGHFRDRGGPGEQAGAAHGYLLILGAAAMWAAYEALFRLKVGRANAHGVLLSVSAQGAAVLAAGPVCVPLAVGAGLEPWPDLGDRRVVAFLLVNAAFVTTYVCLYSLAMSVTSPLFITLVGLVGIPGAAAADYALHGTRPGAWTCAGMAAVVCAVLVMASAGRGGRKERRGDSYVELHE